MIAKWIEKVMIKWDIFEEQIGLRSLPLETRKSCKRILNYLLGKARD